MISTSLYCNAYFGIFKASLGFNMAHFEAYFNFMIVDITNKYVFNLKFTEILQTDVYRKVGREKYTKQFVFREIL